MTEYKRKLVSAAEFVLAVDRSAEGYDSSQLNTVSFGITATLKPHQVEGVSWLIRRYQAGVNVVLGDEMGLGKTLQAISFLSYLKVLKYTTGPFLILCPLSVTDGWISEFSKFCTTLKVLRYVGDKGVRREMRRTVFEHVQKHSSLSSELPELFFDVLLTTYDIALLDQDFLSQIPWHFTVIDEAQRLKNPKSVLYNTLENNFIIPRRLLITGTPIQNNLSELWSLLHFCLPSVFGTLEQFLSEFKEAGLSNSAREEVDTKVHYKILKYVLKAFMLRRTKYMLMESGALVLPSLTQITIIVPLAPLQKKIYVSILRKELQKLLAFSSGSSSVQSLQNTVVQLRKACSHPYLFNGIEPEPFKEGEHLVQASGKLIVLDLLLKKLHMSGHRVLLFAQMTHTLDILQDFLEFRKYTYERLDGSVRAEERFAAIRNFTDKTSDNQCNAFVFMISTRAGGVGLNLVAADTVIFFEQDWNPQVDKQALQRAHRIGQTNNVLAINLVTGQTIEEVIRRRAERKLQLSDEVVGVGEAYVGDKDRDVGDTRSLIFGLSMFDHEIISNNDSNDLNLVELNKMTDEVIKIHHDGISKDDCIFEVSPAGTLTGDDLFTKYNSKSTCLNPELDEAVYQSWVEKFREASESGDTSMLDFRKRKDDSEDEHKKHEARKKKSEEQRLAKEEKKLAKWGALGYNSLTVTEPISSTCTDIMSNRGSVKFVYGDCTKPSKLCPSEPTIIFSCVDNSGKWGRGGMFDALANISDCIPEAYHRASEFGDLHIGDLHLIPISDNVGEDRQWVALAVVQSYNSNKKVPRSNLLIEHLEICLSKASFSTAQNSASLHMPRIGYQDGSQRSEWYTVERVLRKCASLYGINIFVFDSICWMDLLRCPLESIGVKGQSLQESGSHLKGINRMNQQGRQCQTFKINLK